MVITSLLKVVCCSKGLRKIQFNNHGCRKKYKLKKDFRYRKVKLLYTVTGNILNVFMALLQLQDCYHICMAAKMSKQLH